MDLAGTREFCSIPGLSRAIRHSWSPYLKMLLDETCRGWRVGNICLKFFYWICLACVSAHQLHQRLYSLGDSGREMALAQPGQQPPLIPASESVKTFILQHCQKDLKEWLFSRTTSWKQRGIQLHRMQNMNSKSERQRQKTGIQKNYVMLTTCLSSLL